MTTLNTPPKADPEFADHKGIEHLFGIKRSLAYQLLAEKHIQSVSLRRPGHVRGKRLFNVASVRSYLGSLTATAEETPSDAAPSAQ